MSPSARSAPASVGGDQRNAARMASKRTPELLGRDCGTAMAGYSAGRQTSVRDIPAARPFAETTSAILRDASSIISSPSIAAPR